MGIYTSNPPAEGTKSVFCLFIWIFCLEVGSYLEKVIWCRDQDSNLGSHKAPLLQSGVFVRSTIPAEDSETLYQYLF